MKVKLRDLTEEQYLKWQEKKCSANFCILCLFSQIHCFGIAKWVTNKDKYSDKFLDQEIEIDDESILTDEKRAYLEAVMKPFKERVERVHLTKFKYHNGNPYYFIAATDDNRYLKLPLNHDDSLCKMMEIDKEYTLKELGLFEDEQTS